MTVFHPTVCPLEGGGGEGGGWETKQRPVQKKLIYWGRGQCSGRARQKKKNHYRHRLFIYLFSIWKQAVGACCAERIGRHRRSHFPPLLRYLRTKRGKRKEGGRGGAAARCKHWRQRAQFPHPCPPLNSLMKFRSEERRRKRLFSPRPPRSAVCPVRLLFV